MNVYNHKCIYIYIYIYIYISPVSVTQNINIFISHATSFGCSNKHQALSQNKGTETHSVSLFLSFFFTIVPCILMLSKFHHQLMHKRIALKGVLKFTLKQLQHVSV